LHLAAKIQAVPKLLEAIAALAAIAALRGDVRQAAIYLTFVREHPTANPWVQNMVEKTSAQLETLSDAERLRVEQVAASLTLDDVVLALDR
jgi:hypothetical protein